MDHRIDALARKIRERERRVLPAELSKIVQPATVAVFIGLLLMVLRVPSDNLLMQSLSEVGSCSNPLAMLCIGASIARSDLRRLYLGWPSLSVVLVKMILSPMLVYCLAAWLHVYPPAAVSLTLIACLPSSSMFSLMCRTTATQRWTMQRRQPSSQCFAAYLPSRLWRGCFGSMDWKAESSRQDSFWNFAGFLPLKCGFFYLPLEKTEKIKYTIKNATMGLWKMTMSLRSSLFFTDHGLSH